MLTQRQNQLLQYLDRQQRETGVTPSFDEMAAYMGYASKSGVARLLDQLEKRPSGGGVRELPVVTA